MKIGVTNLENVLYIYYPFCDTKAFPHCNFVQWVRIVSWKLITYLVSHSVSDVIQYFRVSSDLPNFNNYFQ